jgi:hypothetical protein
LGSILGRIYGILMLKWFGVMDIGRYAVVGAAALVARFIIILVYRLY